MRQVVYSYYTGNAYGNAGDLETATQEDGSGNVLGTTYYRYYTSGTGSAGNMEYVFDQQAYALLTATLGTGIDSLTNAQVSPYATQYFQYNSSGQESSVTDAGAGTTNGTGNGQGTYTYTYTTNSAATGLQNTNTWTTQTVETQPDGTTNTVFTNYLGETILSVYTDASSNKWMTYYEYDASGRVIETAAPSAVTGYSTSQADLVTGTTSYYLGKEIAQKSWGAFRAVPMIS